MTRRNGIVAVIVVIALGLAAVFFRHQQQAADQAVSPEAYKSAFVDSCLKQANAAAMQQGAALNEEQKRALQQICSCGADRTAEKFSPTEIAAFQVNPTEPTMLSRIKEIMQNCAAQVKTPTTNP